MDSSKWRQIGSPKKHPNQLDWALLELPSQYEIFEQLTVGGMGSVFRAQNRYTGAYVAIKIIRSEATKNATAIKRFFLEAKAASSFRHPHICRVLDFGVSKSNVPYLVMDWVDGINLEKMMKDGYKPSVQEALLLFRQVATALAHAHQKNIIHRDLKPENIMINYNAAGQIETQLIDFGIAKMLAGTEQLRQANANANPVRAFVDTENSLPGNDVTQVGVAVGTPAYMSPEQARGLIVDSRTAIYSLG